MTKENKNNKKKVPIKSYSYAKLVSSTQIKESLIASNIDNLNLVFFNPDHEYPVKGFSKVIVCKNKKTGSIFYGVRATKYGLRVPKEATQMALAVFGKKKIDRLYTMDIPVPLSKTIVQLNNSDEFQMIIRRSNNNVFVSIGDTYKQKNIPKERHKEINTKWIQLSND